MNLAAELHQKATQVRAEQHAVKDAFNEIVDRCHEAADNGMMQITLGNDEFHGRLLVVVNLLEEQGFVVKEVKDNDDSYWKVSWSHGK